MTELKKLKDKEACALFFYNYPLKIQSGQQVLQRTSDRVEQFVKKGIDKGGNQKIREKSKHKEQLDADVFDNSYQQ